MTRCRIDYLGCELEGVVGDFELLTVELHVPYGQAPDMSGAIRYAKLVLPDVLCVKVYDSNDRKPIIMYMFNPELRDWVAR